jgi:predicted flap endonuclease-1-like 5' DNA nuclease
VVVPTTAGPRRESLAATIQPQPEAKAAPAAPVAAPAAPAIVLPSTPPPEAFKGALESGLVRYDAMLGIRYLDAPAQLDDLTLLRGVGDVLQDRLHLHGIYTFKQIAVWNHHQADRIGDLIHAKDRVHRDRWVQQARDLHYLQHGEKLGTSALEQV